MSNKRSFFGIVLIVFFLVPTINFAQKSKPLPWKKRAKMALEYYQSGDYANAARTYRTVYQDKPDKLEYTYEAGMAYLAFRDYANAVKSLAPVKDQSNLYDKAGYYYALALKQKGNTAAAKVAFEEFLIEYQGSDKALYKDLVDNEIRGCNYSLKAQEYTDPTVTMQHLPSPINTSRTEFAPIPFNNNVLYFSTTSKGVAKIHRSQRDENGNWSRPEVPQIFVGKMEKPHFGNGTFSDDGKRFYFTECQVDPDPSCAIYMMEEADGEWGKPKPLPDYINAAGTNTTHPYLVTTTKEEILYFSSTRPGGRGGLDLWYTTRSLAGGSFTLPKNLGRNINTKGDEISPFYDIHEGVLYFSSNGRVSAGGLDVFQSKGSKLEWEIAQNMGFPINSFADDLYYTISSSHGGGYLVSNRAFLPKRTATTDDDIFYFAQQKIVIEWKGKVIANGESIVPAVLQDVNIKLFEINGQDDQQVAEQMLAEGIFSLALNPEKSYLLVCQKEGYQEATVSVKTGKSSEEITIDLRLYPIEVAVVEPDWEAIKYSIVPAQYNSNEQAFELPQSPIDAEGNPYQDNELIVYKELKEIAELGDEHKLYFDAEGNPQPYRKPIEIAVVETTDSSDQNENPTFGIATDTPPAPVVSTLYEQIYNEQKVAEQGVVYKIQVAAVRKFRASNYEPLKEVGNLSMENISGNIRRVMVVDNSSNSEEGEGFKSKGKALNVLGYILNNTVFEYAFVIKYVDGKRVGEGFRGWNEEEGLETTPATKDSKKKYGGF